MTANNHNSTGGRIRIGIVVGSTRPGRKAADVADWVVACAELSSEIELEVLDPAVFALPLLDEPVAAAFGDYRHDHTRAWADAVDGCDGFVFVTPEYNHSIPAALKNAIDYLYAQWRHKPAGIVSYGIHGGVRAAEALRLVLCEVGCVPVSDQVALSVFDDFTYTDANDPSSPFQVTPRRFQVDAELHNLEKLPSKGFIVSCFPVKVHAASAGWTRAVAILEED